MYGTTEHHGNAIRCSPKAIIRRRPRSATVVIESDIRREDSSDRMGGWTIPTMKEDMDFLGCIGFEVGYQICESKFSRVMICVSKGILVEGSQEREEMVAVKIAYGKRGRREASILEELSWNKGVVEMMGCVQDDRRKDRVAIVMRMYPIDMFQMITERGRIDRGTAHRFFLQMCRTMSLCHSSGFIHRDIKPDNLLLDDDGEMVFADWGFGALWSSLRMRNTPLGSCDYAADEILSKRYYVGPEVDIFSMGAVLHAMLSGCMMHRISNDGDHGRIACISPRVEEDDDRELISMMTMSDPLRRATMYDIMSFLSSRIYSNPRMRSPRMMMMATAMGCKEEEDDTECNA